MRYDHVLLIDRLIDDPWCKTHLQQTLTVRVGTVGILAFRVFVPKIFVSRNFRSRDWWLYESAFQLTLNVAQTVHYRSTQILGE